MTTTDPHYRVLERLAEGETVAAITSGPDAPCSRSAFYRRLADDVAFKRAYEAARIEAADSLVDECAQIVDDCLKGKVEPRRAQVALNHLQWKAGKLHPSRYGDRVSVEHTEGKGTYLDALQAAQPKIADAARQRSACGTVVNLHPSRKAEADTADDDDQPDAS